MDQSDTVNDLLTHLQNCSFDLMFKAVSPKLKAGQRRAISRAPDSYVRVPGFDTWSGNILSFLLPRFQEEQLSVTGESMCTKYWLTA